MSKNMSDFLKTQRKVLISVIITITILLGMPIVISAAADTTAPVVVPQPIAEGSTRTAGEVLVGTDLKFKITDDTKVVGVYYTWNKHLEPSSTKKPTAVRVDGSPKETIWSIKAPSEPGLWELSIFAWDGINQSLEIAIPYKTVEKLSVPEDTTMPELVLKPTSAIVKAGDKIPVSFTDETDIYFISYRWVEGTEPELKDFQTNSTKIYKPQDGKTDVTIPTKPGIYYLQWYAKDFSNIISKGYYAKLEVRTDIVAPTIKLNGDSTIYLDISDKDTNTYQYEDAGATYSDVFDGVENEPISKENIDVSDVNEAIKNKETRKALVIFTATDSNKNVRQKARYVYIVDYTGLKNLKQAITNSNLKESDYLEEYWAKLDEELKKATQMQSDNKSEQEAIQTQLENLQSAYNDILDQKSYKEVQRDSLSAKKAELGKLVGIEEYSEEQWQKIQEELAKKYSANSWNALKSLIEQAEQEKLQSKFDDIVKQINLDTLVELPVIKSETVVTEPINKTYIKSGNQIKVTFTTNVELNVQETKAKIKINDKEYDVDTINEEDDEKTYSFSYTFTDENEEGIISYAIELIGKEDNNSNAEKQTNITFDKTKPEIQGWNDGINDETTITVFDEYTVNTSDIKVSDNYTSNLTIEIYIDNTKQEGTSANLKNDEFKDHTIKYVVRDEAGNENEKERTIKVQKTSGESNPEYISSKPENLETTYDPFGKLSNVNLPENWEWVDGNTLPTVNTKTYMANYKSQDDRYEDVNNVELNVNVKKATPKLSNETEEALNKLTATYLDNLATVKFPETVKETTEEETAGTFSWKLDENQTAETTLVGNANEQGNEFTVLFTANDTDNYNVLEHQAKIIVSKKIPTIEDLSYTITDTTYNGKQQPITVNAQDGLSGFGKTITVKYNNEENAPKDADTYNITVEISNGTNYSDTTLDLGSYTIKKATPNTNNIVGKYTKGEGQEELSKQEPFTRIEYDRQSHSIDVETFGVNKEDTTIGKAENIKYHKVDSFEKVLEDFESGLEEAPTEIGIYIVTADFTDGKNYNSAQNIEVGRFEIFAKDLSEETIKIKISNTEDVYYDETDKSSYLKKELTETSVNGLTLEDLNINITEFNRQKFTDGTDTKTDLINAGTYTVNQYEISGKGNYTGTITNVTFDGNFVIGRSNEQTTPEIQLGGVNEANTVVTTATGVKLIVENDGQQKENANIKYSGGIEGVATIDPQNGEITVISKGEENPQFTAEFEATENYNAKKAESITLNIELDTLNQDNFEIDGELNQTYDGKAKSIDVTSKNSSIKSGEDYTIEYYKEGQKEESPTEVGNYQIVVKFKGNNVYKAQDYTIGTLTINPKNITIKIKTTKTVIYGQESDITNLNLSEEEYEIVKEDDEVQPSHSELTFKVKGAESLQEPLSVNESNYDIDVECSNKNYTVSVTEGQGKYIVTPRPVKITITGTATSVYGENIADVSNIEHEIEKAEDMQEEEKGLINEDNLNLVFVVLKNTEPEEIADNMTDVGDYMIKATSDNQNYQVTTESNTNYKITPQILKAQAQSSNSVYGEKVTVPSYTITGTFYPIMAEIKTVIERTDKDHIGEIYDPTSEDPLPVGTHKVVVKLEIKDKNPNNYKTEFTDGQYEVTKKPIEVKAENVTVKYGEDGKEKLQLSEPIEGLVGKDTKQDLAVTLKVYRTDSENTDVTDSLTEQPANGAYEIRGTSTSANYDVTVMPGKYTIEKAEPVISTEKESSLQSLKANYGQTLNDVKLPEKQTGEELQETKKLTPGSYKWQLEGTTKVGNVTEEGNQFVVVFVPDDTTNYNEKTLNAKIMVSKINPTDKNVEGKIGETTLAQTPTETLEKQYTEVTYTGSNIDVNVTAKDIYNEELRDDEVTNSIGEVTNKKYYKVTEQGPELSEKLDEIESVRNVGKYVVKVDLTGGNNYNSGNEIEVGRFEVTPKEITDEDITIKLPEDHTTYNPEHKVEATVEYSSEDIGNNAKADIQYTREPSEELEEAPTNAGTYKVTVTVTVNGNYSGDPKTAEKEFTIDKATQVIPIVSLNSETAKMTDKEMPTITVSSTPNEEATLKYTSTAPNVATIDETEGTIKLVGEGTVQFKVQYNETANYNASEEVLTNVLKVSKDILDPANFTIETDVSNIIYDGTDKTVTIKSTVEGIDPENYEIEYYKMPDETKLEGKLPNEAGTYKVKVVFKGDVNYEAGMFEAGEFTIKQRKIEITIDHKLTSVYGTYDNSEKKLTFTPEADYKIGEENIVSADEEYVTVNLSLVSPEYLDETGNLQVENYDIALSISGDKSSNYIIEYSETTEPENKKYSVTQANPKLPEDITLEAKYKDTLESLNTQLQNALNGEYTPGNFEWKLGPDEQASKKTVGNATTGEPHTFNATYTPTDTRNYKSGQEVTVKINVAKIDPVLSDLKVTPDTETEDIEGSPVTTYTYTYDTKGKKINIGKSDETLGTITTKYYQVIDRGEEQEEQLLEGGKVPTNVGTYKVKVSIEEGTNFKATESEIKVAVIKIVQKQVTINITSDSLTSVYGEKISTIDYAVKENGEAIQNELEQLKKDLNIVFALQRADSLENQIEINEEAKPNADTYNIVIKSHSSNYAVTLENIAPYKTYTITPRPVTVTVTGSKESIYGNDIEDINDIENSIEQSPEDGEAKGLLKGESLDELTFAVYTDEINLATSTTDAGKYMIKASSTNKNYNVTTAENKAYTIKPRPFVVTIEDVKGTYGEIIPKLTATVTPDEVSTITLPTLNGTPYIIVGEARLHEGEDPSNKIKVGQSYTIDVDISGLTSNFELQKTTGNYTVDKKKITVKAQDVTVKYGEDGKGQLQLLQPIEGLVSGDEESALAVTLKVYRTDNGANGYPTPEDVTDKLATQPANGTYEIKGELGESTNYTVTVTPGKYTIEKADPIISKTSQEELQSLAAKYGQTLNDVTLPEEQQGNEQGVDEKTTATAGNFSWKLQEGEDAKTKQVGEATEPDGQGNEFTVVFIPSDNTNYTSKEITVYIKVSKIDPTYKNVEGTIGEETTLAQTPAETQEKEYAKVTYTGENIDVNVTAKDIYNTELKDEGLTESIGTLDNKKYYKVTTEGPELPEQLNEIKEVKDVGKYVVKIDLTGGKNYNAGSEIEVGRFEVTPKAITDEDITIKLPEDTTYIPDHKVEATVTYSSDDVKKNAVEDIKYYSISGEPSKKQETLLKEAPTNAGKYKVTVTVTVSGNYSGEPKTAEKEFTIDKATQVTPIIELSKESVTMVEEAPKLTVNSEPYEEANIVYGTVENKKDVATIDETNGTITLVGEGTVEFTAQYKETDNYKASDVATSKTLTVSRVDLPMDNFKIKNDPYTVQYDGEEQEVTITSTVENILPATYTVKYYKVQGLEEEPLETAPTDAGTYKVKVEFNGNATYNAGTFEAGNFTITQRPIEVTISKKLTSEYGIYSKEHTVTFNKDTDYTIKEEDIVSKDLENVTVSLELEDPSYQNETGNLQAGDYNIILKLSGGKANNYTVKYSEGTIEDNKKYTVTKIDPTLPTDITLEAKYKENLDSLKDDLNQKLEGEYTQGTFTWESDGSTLVGEVAGSPHTFNAKFTPTDNRNYNEKTIEVKVNVGKIDPTLSDLDVSAVSPAEKEEPDKETQIKTYTYTYDAQEKKIDITKKEDESLGDITVKYYKLVDKPEGQGQKEEQALEGNAPTEVGEYVVKASIAEGTNFNPALKQEDRDNEIKVAIIKIVQKQVKVTITSQDLTSVYGEQLKQIEFKAEDIKTSEDIGKLKDSLKIVFELDKDGQTTEVKEGVKPTVGTYTIKIKQYSNNFEVTLVEENNQYEITPRPVKITITSQDLSSIYGDQIQLEGIQYTIQNASETVGKAEGLLDSENLNELTFAVYTDEGESVTNTTDVGTYMIKASSTNQNYEVTTVENKAYTINQRTIKVTTQSTSGVYGNPIPELQATIEPNQLEGITLPQLNGKPYIKVEEEKIYAGTVTNKLQVEQEYDIDVEIQIEEGKDGNFNIQKQLGKYTLTQKEITVQAQDVTVKYGEDGKDKLKLLQPVEGLVSGDEESALAVTLKVYRIDSEANGYPTPEDVTESLSTQPVKGTYKIRGTSASTNYNVTVIEGQYKINKAEQVTPVVHLNKTHVLMTGEEIPQIQVEPSPEPHEEAKLVYGTVENKEDVAKIDSTNGTITLVGEGTVKFTVKYQETDNYLESTTVETEELTVEKATLLEDNFTITQSQFEYNGTQPAIMINSTIPGVLQVGPEDKNYTLTYYETSPDEKDLGETVPKDAGTYTVKLEFNGNTIYKGGTFEVGSFTITQKPITVQAQQITVNYGEDGSEKISLVKSDDGSIEGIVAGDTEEALAVTLRVYRTDIENAKDVTDELAIQPANGTYKIRGTSTSRNYNVTVTEADYKILPKPQNKPEITGPTEVKMTEQNAKVQLGNSPIDNGTITYQNNSEEIINIGQDGTITPLQVGEAKITVTFGATDNYSAQTSEEYTIKVIRDDLQTTDFTFDLSEHGKYDGQVHSITVEPKPEIEGKIGNITIQYNKLGANTEVEQENAELKAVGQYKVILHVEEGTHYNKADLDLGTYTIDKGIYKLPESVKFPDGDESKLIYNGEELTYNGLANVLQNIPDIEGLEITYSGNVKKEVGEYEVTADFKIKANGTLSESYDTVEPSQLTGHWSIIRGALVESNFNIENTKYVYDGNPKEVKVTPKFDGIGKITVQYSTTGEGETWTEAPTNAGSYFIRIITEQGDYYEPSTIDVKNVKLEIEKAEQEAPEVHLSQEEIVITTTDFPTIIFDQENLQNKKGDVTYTLNQEGIITMSEGNITGILSAGEVQITVTYTGDNNYKESKTVLTLNVIKDTLKESYFTISNNVYIYDNQPKQATVSVTGEVRTEDLGSYAIQYNGEQSQIDAGEYDIKLIVEESKKYERAELTVGKLIINPATLTVSDLNFTIDNKNFTNGVDAEGKTLKDYIAKWERKDPDIPKVGKEHKVENITLVEKYNSETNKGITFDVIYKNLINGQILEETPNDIGTYGVTVKANGRNFTSSDISLNGFTITDQEKPTIKSAGSDVVMINTTEIDYKSFIIATDDYDLSEEITIKWTGSIDTSKEGKNTITYTATDKHNNVSDPFEVTIMVKDYPPIIQSIDQDGIGSEITIEKEKGYWNNVLSSIHLGWTKGTVTIHKFDLEDIGLDEAKTKYEELAKSQEATYTNKGKEDTEKATWLYQDGIYRIAVADQNDPEVIIVRYIKIDNRTPGWTLEANGQIGWQHTFDATEVTLKVPNINNIKNIYVTTSRNGHIESFMLVEEQNIQRETPGLTVGEDNTLVYKITCEQGSNVICNIIIEDINQKISRIDNFMIQPSQP